MPLSLEQIAHLGRLARLNLDPSEIQALTGQLAGIVEYFERLRDVPTDNVRPWNRSSTPDNVLREDVVTPSLPKDQALKNAPESDGDFFLVPKVLG